MINELELLALKSVALKDPEYFCRRVYRYYSEKFHTPLMEVHNLPWAFVFTNYLEHIIESNNTQEQVYNLALENFYPEMMKIKNFMGEFENEAEETAAYIERIEMEEAAKRIKAEVKAVEPNPHNEETNIEMGGFSHLDEEMEEEDNE